MTTKVICAWGGTGKTALAKTDKRFVDLENSDYQWVYENNIKDPELRKGSKRTQNPDFPKNYIDAVKATIIEGKYVFCGTKPIVLDALRQNNIEFIVLHPSLDEKNDYRNRYLKRGNSVEWADEYIDSWHNQFIELYQNGYETVEMKKGSYVSDYVDDMIDYLSKP